MTIDDNNSVYVGSLPYDVDEEALRRIFANYGTVLYVKIVNDRSVRGKCYGFVTFSNRRSADDAIQDMDGKSVGGRVVRVNEVTTRVGGRLNPVRERFQPQSPDGRSDFNYDRDRYSDRSRERDRSQDRRRDHYSDKEREYEHSHDFERRHDMLDRNGYTERGFEGEEEGDWRGDRSYVDNGRGINGTSAHESRSQETTREDGNMLDGGRGRDGGEHFSNASGDHSFQVKEKIEALIKTRDVLQDEVLVIEARLEAKEGRCSELQKKFKRLEDLLNDEKKLTSKRRKELAKLHHSFSRVRECTENLKDCEQELQSLVNSVAREGVAGADEGLESGYG